MAQTSQASLAELSQQCIHHILQQVNRAKDLLSTQKSLRLVLKGAIDDLQTHNTSLSNWSATVSTVKKIRDPRSYNRAAQTATELLSLIQNYIATIEKTLERAKTVSDNDTLVLCPDLLALY
jgi:hypothetical protein